MNYVRIWLKGKRFGSPYEEFSLKHYLLFIGNGSVNLIPKKDAEHITCFYLEFVTKVEVL